MARSARQQAALKKAQAVSAAKRKAKGSAASAGNLPNYDDAFKAGLNAPITSRRYAVARKIANAKDKGAAKRLYQNDMIRAVLHEM